MMGGCAQRDCNYAMWQMKCQPDVTGRKEGGKNDIVTFCLKKATEMSELITGDCWCDSVNKQK